MSVIVKLLNGVAGEWSKSRVKKPASFDDFLAYTLNRLGIVQYHIRTIAVFFLSNLLLMARLLSVTKATQVSVSSNPSNNYAAMSHLFNWTTYVSIAAIFYPFSIAFILWVKHLWVNRREPGEQNTLTSTKELQIIDGTLITPQRKNTHTSERSTGLSL